MMRNGLLLGLSFLCAAAGCDLPELNQKGDAGDAAPDMAAPGGGGMGGGSGAGAGGSGGSAGVGGGGAGGMPGPDMAKPDDPNIPSGATIGSCAGGDWVVSASNFNFDNLPGYAVDGLLPSRWSTGVAQAPGIYYQVDFGGWVMLNNVTLTEAYNKDGMGDYPRGLDVFV